MACGARSGLKLEKVLVVPKVDIAAKWPGKPVQGSELFCQSNKLSICSICGPTRDARFAPLVGRDQWGFWGPVCRERGERVGGDGGEQAESQKPGSLSEHTSDRAALGGVLSRPRERTRRPDRAGWSTRRRCGPALVVRPEH